MTRPPVRLGLPVRPGVVRFGVVAGMALALAGCAQQSRPTYDDRQNRPILLDPTRTVAPGDLLSAGPQTQDCINGWTQVRGSSPLLVDAVEAARTLTGPGAVTVVDDRVFVAADRPGADPQLPAVGRVYLELTSADYRGRVLLEQRPDSTEVVATAPAGSAGWQPGAWRTPAGADPVLAGFLPVGSTGCLTGTGGSDVTGGTPAGPGSPGAPPVPST